MVTMQRPHGPCILRLEDAVIITLYNGLVTGTANLLGALSTPVTGTTVLAAGATPAPTIDPNFNPAPSPPPGMQAAANILFGWAKWILLGAGILGLMFCAGQMIMGRRNRSATAVDGAVGIPWVLAGLSLASLGPFVVAQMLS